MLHRIRFAFGLGNSDLILSGQLQADEAYLGGRNENRHKHKKHTDETGKFIENKAPVMGVVIETGGKVKTKVVNAPTKVNAIEFLEDNTTKGSTLVTDNSPIYHKIGKKIRTYHY